MDYIKICEVYTTERNITDVVKNYNTKEVFSVYEYHKRNLLSKISFYIKYRILSFIAKIYLKKYIPEEDLIENIINYIFVNKKLRIETILKRIDTIILSIPLLIIILYMSSINIENLLPNLLCSIALGVNIGSLTFAVLDLVLNFKDVFGVKI